MSATIMFSRRWARRSIQTPAGSEKSRCGSQASAVRIPTSSADASSARTAVSGIASALIWSPKTEIDWPAQNRTKAGCRVSGGWGGACAAARDASVATVIRPGG